MKVEGWTFILGFVFYLVVGGAYWYFSGDIVGTTLLALTGALAFLVAAGRGTRGGHHSAGPGVRRLGGRVRDFRADARRGRLALRVLPR